MTGAWKSSTVWVLCFLTWTFVEPAHGFPGMKTADRGSGSGAGTKAGQPGTLVEPPPGGTPPPATVAGIEALLAGSGTPRPLPESGPGVISVRVTDDVSEHPVLGGLDVILTAVLSGKVIGQEQAETDSEGRCAFRNLITESSVVYTATVIYQGVRYTHPSLTFPTDTTEADLEFQVYPSGPAPGKASIRGVHVILETLDTGKGVQVTEMLFIDNPEKRALVGGPEGIVTFALELPKTASHLEVGQGLQRDQISVGDGTLYYGGPLYPGDNKVLLSYHVTPAVGWTFQRRVSFPVEMFDVFVKESALRVVSQVLKGGEPLNMRGADFLRYHGGPFDPGSLISFRVDPAPTAMAAAGSGRTSAVPVAVMAALFASIFVALPILRPASSTGAKSDTALDAERRSLESERDRHLLAVSEIDMDFQDDKLGEDDYHRLRKRHKQAAMEAMRKLDSLPAADHPNFCTRCGKRLEPGDQFCARCGARITAGG